MSDSAVPRSGAIGRAFWWRLADNFFRRFVWFLLPVVAMAGIGVVQANNTIALYRSGATLSTVTNPLLPEQQVGGTTARLWETPAAATSRIISEQLGTNTFIENVADQAGLMDEISAGFVDLAVVRSSIWSGTAGDSLLTVNASWGDADTAFKLVTATVDQYQRVIEEQAASQAIEAESFWSARITALEPELAAAEQALNDFVRSLEPLEDGETYALDVELESERLRGEVESLESEIRSAREQVDTAVLTRSQQATEARRSFVVVDEPEIPGAPESTLMKRAMLVLSFVFMGAVIGLAALLATTALDHSVSSTADLASIVGITQIATVPAIAGMSTRAGRRGTSRRGRRR
jgi:hypothetical protein